MKNNMYKIPAIIPEVIWDEYNHLFSIISAVEYDESGDLDPDYLANATKAFNSVIRKAHSEKNTPISVDWNKLVVNTAKQSILSNIMQIACGKRLATRNMISVSHRLFQTILARMPWQVADLNQMNAIRRMELLQKLVMYRMVYAGITIVDAVGGTERYGFIVATPSQQKCGGMYMGNARIMSLEHVQRALNFGRTFKTFNEEVPSDAVEWLKANALSATPAEPTEYSIRDIIVMPAVKVKHMFKNVCRIDENGVITHLDEAELEQELIDGQMLTLVTGQARGWCIKGLGIGLYAELIDPDAVVIDIDGKERRIGDAVAICTDSCWKAKKFFSSYSEFCDVAEELAEYIPGFDKLWIVREADELDEDGEEVDYGRRLSRQATQQWVHATTAQLLNLTRRSRNSLNKMKTYDGLVRLASEQAKPLAKRSDLAGLVEALPELVLTDGMQDWAATKYEKKQLDAAASRLNVPGNYPFIAMDPVAMKQVLVDGRNPLEEGLGVLQAGEVCNMKYKDGQKLFAVRYPANYQTAVVLKNRRIDIFAALGEVAILPMYGDTIIREDGDFDGDEMMFSPDELIIRLTEQMIDEFHPELIDFPHGKKAKMDVWGTRENRFEQIAEALWRAMRYNEVGIYSNMAVRCMHLHKMEECIMMHVMAILCLDMVKGAEVSAKLIETAEKIRASINTLCNGAMPYNQIFRDKRKGITGRKYLAPSNDTVDTISRMIMTTGDYSFDAEGHELFNAWKLMTDGGSDITRMGTLPEELAQAFVESYSRSDVNTDDLAVYRKIKNGERIGVAELMQAAATNEASMVYTCDGDTVNDKKAAYRELIREIAFALGRDSGLTDEELKSRVVNWAAKIAVTGAGARHGKTARYSMFVMRVFAIDFLRNVERNNGVAAEDSFEVRRELAANGDDNDDSVMEISDEELEID